MTDSTIQRIFQSTVLLGALFLWAFAEARLPIPREPRRSWARIPVRAVTKINSRISNPVRITGPTWPRSGANRSMVASPAMAPARRTSRAAAIRPRSSPSKARAGGRHQAAAWPATSPVRSSANSCAPRITRTASPAHSCHSVHHSKLEYQLVQQQTPLCFSCHVEQKADFQKPFHHRVEEGLIKCSDCHNAHGALRDRQLRSTPDQDMVCFKCHSDKRGPFVFEHEPVKGRRMPDLPHRARFAVSAHAAHRTRQLALPAVPHHHSNRSASTERLPAGLHPVPHEHSRFQYRSEVLQIRGGEDDGP